jgi:hypothetical protein
MANENRKLVLDFVAGNYEHNLKSANYLLVAHGACLVLTISALREYSPTGPLKGLGIFIVLFGVGLLAAVVNYASLSLGRGVALNAVMNGAEADEATSGFVTKVHLSALTVAVGIFVSAIVIVMVRYAHL